MQFIQTSLAIAAISVATASYADTPGFQLKSISPEASTLGLGVSANFSMTEHVGLSVGFNQFQLSSDYTANNIKYSGDLELGSAGVMLDYRPFSESGLKISAGARINNNSATLSASPTDSVTIGDKTYTGADVASLDASIEFEKIAPVVAIGYSKIVGKGLSFSAQVGAMMHGAPKVTMEVSGAAASDPDIAENLERESQKISDQIADFSFYPIASAGLSWRF